MLLMLRGAESFVPRARSDGSSAADVRGTVATVGAIAPDAAGATGGVAAGTAAGAAAGNGTANANVHVAKPSRCCHSSARCLVDGAAAFCQTHLGAAERCVSTLFMMLFSTLFGRFPTKPQMCRSSRFSTGRQL